jgi:hypothetical protein
LSLGVRFVRIVRVVKIIEIVRNVKFVINHPNRKPQKMQEIELPVEETGFPAKESLSYFLKKSILNYMVVSR